MRTKARYPAEALLGNSPLLHCKALEFACHTLATRTVPVDDDIFRLLLLCLPKEENRAFQENCGVQSDPFGPDEGEDMPGGLSVGATAAAMEKYWRHAGDDPAKMEKALSPIRACVDRLKASREKAGDRFAKALREVRTTFKLTGCACDILTLMFLTRQNNLFHQAVMMGSPLFMAGSLPQRISLVTGRPLNAVVGELNAESPLLRFGLMDSDFDLRPPMMDFLNGLSKKPLISRYFHCCQDEDVLDLEAFTSLQDQIRVILTMIRNRDLRGEGINILLYGMPGTGKSALARALGKALGYSTYAINQVRATGAEDSDATFRYAGLHACFNHVQLENSLIIVDEADEMLNSAAGGGPFSFIFRSHRGDKGSVNSLLDAHRAVIVWITNEHDQIDASTRRRFDYSLHFTAFTRDQRRLVWQRCLQKHDIRIFSEADIADLAARYTVNAGGIDLAVRNARRALPQAGSAETAKPAATEMMDTVLHAHLNLLDQPSALAASQSNARDYSIDGLHVRGELALPDILTIFREFDRQQLSGGSAARQDTRNVNLLMHGPPGTGKTEFAKHVARELGRPLLVRRASDLLDAYVGNTEKRIRGAFTQAQAERAILFLDEADSFLATRAQAVRSWEVSQVNELLASMEAFRGILLCATNRKDNLDPAAMRRFNLKVEFDYLTPAGRELFFQRLLGDMAPSPLTDELAAELRAMEYLTPGDYSVVRQKFAFLPRERIDNLRLLAALKAETAAKSGLPSRPVGFRLAS